MISTRTLCTEGAAIVPQDPHNYHHISTRTLRMEGDIEDADANGVAMWISIHTLCAEGGW